MSVDFGKGECKDTSSRKLFGLCDDRHGQRAYIDETDGAKWVAIVNNEPRYDITFTAIDHCIDILGEDKKMEKRCDGFLSYNSSIIFVELKERRASGNAWVVEGEEQLRTSIKYFEADGDDLNTEIKKAYIANNEHPKFKESQTRRMNQFFDDTGYVLRIENRINLD